MVIQPPLLPRLNPLELYRTLDFYRLQVKDSGRAL